MLRLPALVAIAAASTLTAGCASQRSMDYREMQALMPPVPAGKARIFFYRETAWLGNLIAPDLVLNDARIGAAEPGAFFFVDRAPGDYGVYFGLDEQASASFTAAAGETVYVHVVFAGGVVKAKMRAETVDAPRAIPAIHDLRYLAQG